MKAQKTISILATLSILSFAVACNDGGGSDRYAEGFAAGRAEGYAEGYDDGDADGYDRGYAAAEAYFKTADYTQGFNDGRTVGVAEGYSQGYNVGRTDGQAEGYTTGYNAGYDDGDADGYADGYSDGYDDGDADGYADGLFDGEAIGYTNGWNDGFEDGYAQAEIDYGLSIGKTPKLQGYASVLSAFHNDLIDYSQIKMPVQTKKGLVGNGKLLLSEVSMTNKDTLKRAAVVEQYLVIEMSKQVKGKFGLSAERSLQIAKAANHFRKFSTTRALTAEDTNAYASEIIGVNFKTIEKAFDKSMKGDISELNGIMEKAAEKNGVSPEKMGQIVSKLFM